MRTDYMALQGFDQDSLPAYERKKVAAAIEGVINSPGVRTVAMLRRAIERAGYSANSKDMRLTIEPSPDPEGTLYGRGRGLRVICTLEGRGYHMTIDVTGH